MLFFVFEYKSFILPKYHLYIMSFLVFFHLQYMEKLY